MTDIRPHTRRPPQPPIDPALVVPGSRWQKNGSEHQGKPPAFVIVDSVTDVTDATGAARVVHYRNEATQRRASMPLKAFCSAAEHKAPDIALPPEPIAEGDMAAEIRALHAKMDEVLSFLRPRGQLRLVGA